jgi:arylsulfatase A-like enzyme
MGAGAAALNFPLLSCSNGIPKNPNIIFILADDMGYGDLSSQNNHSKIPTPRMDELASQGMRFTDAHSNSAVCTPTRYGVLTGRYAWRTRLKSGVLWGYSRPLIEDGRMTVASMLKDEGYSTACIGKWHLGLGWQTRDGEAGPWETQQDISESQWTAAGIDFTKPLTAGPHTVGFDFFYGIPASLDMVPYCYIENDRVVEPPTEQIEEGDPAEDGWWRPGPISPEFKHIETLPQLTDKAVDYIDSQAGEESPFFLYFPLTAPHVPIAPVDEVRGKSEAGGYGDFVFQVDQTIGAVMDALERNGMAENTLLIITSDNGSHTRTKQDRSIYSVLKYYDHNPSNGFRGIKADAWDGGHRVPFLACWPAVIPAGTQSHETICLTDFMRTCASIVGWRVPSDAAEDSYDLLSLFKGERHHTPLREATIHHSLDGMFAVRQGPWKLILGRGSGGFTSPRRRDIEPGEPEGQLYNLNIDTGEENNLYEEYPEVVEKLTAILERYQAEGRSYPAG